MGEGAVERSRVMVFESDARRAEDLSQRLRFLRYEPVVAGRGEAVPERGIAGLVGALGETPAVRRAFERWHRKSPELPLLVLDRAGNGIDDAAASPVWYLETPLRRAQLERLLKRASRYNGRERRQLIGRSLPMRAVRRLIEQVADFDTTVLVTGESGTGKELVAKTIHELSDRCDKPFVPVNCGAIPADLLESELFGHEKGAFSGAVSTRTGRFELAEGGTLFLDEIGDMSLPMQVKLLRVLQERCYERIGSGKLRHADVRIIAATHRDLPAAVGKGEFREDLYYRLNVFPIQLPPLAKRRSDLPLLLDELLIRHQDDGQERLRLNPDAVAALAAYSWPGNIRELSNLVERLAILKGGGEVALQDLPPRYREAAETVSPVAAGVAADLRTYLRQVEADLIRKALTRADGVVAGAARLLRMRRTTLVEKLAKYGIA